MKTNAGICVLLALTFIQVQKTSAQNTYTTTGAGTVWTTAANWSCTGGSCGLYPGQSAANDIVNINNDINLTSTITVGAITVTNAVFNVSSNITLATASVAVNSTGTSVADFVIVASGGGSPTVNIVGDVSITRGTASTLGLLAYTRIRVGGSTSFLTSSAVTIGGNLIYNYNNATSASPETASEISVGNSSAFSDNCTLTITGNVFLNYTFANDATVTQNNNLAFEVGKAASVSMNNLNLNLAESGSGSGGSNIRVATLDNLNSSITINGNAAMNWNDGSSPNGGADIYIKAGNDDPASNTTILIKGDLSMISNVSTSSNNNIVRSSGTSTLTVKGNLNFTASLPTAAIDNEIALYQSGKLNLYGSINNPTQGRFDFKPLGATDNGTIIFSGSSAQTFPTKFRASINYKNITINNNSGAAFTIPNSTLNIEGTLTMNDGIITSSPSNQLVFEDGGTSNGGSATSYVTGPVLKKGILGALLPLGNTTVAKHWAPIQISSITNADNTTIFTGQYFANVYSSVTTDGTFDHVSGLEYWSLTTTGKTPTATDVTLFWEDACASQIGKVTNGAGQDLFVGYFNSPQWNKLASTINGPNVSSFACGTAPATGSITATGVSSLGFFTFAAQGAHANILPIVLYKFWAEQSQNDYAKVNWVTKSELNSDYFVLMHSPDGITFSPVDTLRAAGTSQDTHEYEVIDRNVRPGQNYYRLIEIDFDGTKTEYNTISLIIDKMENSHLIQAFPNPVKSSTKTITVRSSVDIQEPSNSFHLYSLMGLDVTSQCNFKESSSKEFQIYADQLVPGIYVLTCQSITPIRPIKIIIE